MIPGIPRIRGCAAGIRYGAQVAVQIVRLGVGPKCKLLVVGVVADDAESRGNGGAGKGAADLRPVACRIVGVGERAEGGRALLVRQGREFGGGVVGIGDAVGVRGGR